MKTAVKKNQQKKSKSWQHPKDFPSGPPPQYYPGPVVVNCTVLKSCGVFTTVWPPANIVGTQNPKSLQKKISALRRIRNLNPVSSGASPSFNSGSKFQRRLAEFQIRVQISPALRRENFSGASPSFKSDSEFYRGFAGFQIRFRISPALRRDQKIQIRYPNPTYTQNLKPKNSPGLSSRKSEAPTKTGEGPVKRW